MWPKDVDDEPDEQQAEAARTEYKLLGSQLASLYEEFEKLTRKSPKDRVTEMGLKAVNRVISDAKNMMKGDRYVDEIDPFVAAGENPPNSDVLLVLSMLTGARKRFRAAWIEFWEAHDIDYFT